MAIRAKPKPKKKKAKVVCKRVRGKGSKKRYKRVCNPSRRVVARKPLTTTPVSVGPPAIVPVATAPVPAAPPRRCRPSRRRQIPGPSRPSSPRRRPACWSTAARSARARRSGCCGAPASVRSGRRGRGARAGGPTAAVRSLTRPPDAPTLVGAAPAIDVRFAPRDVLGHDHIWLLDSVMRSEHPLVERMALILHDWFATSRAMSVTPGGCSTRPSCCARTRSASSTNLVRDITVDPAMLIFLSGIETRRNAINENYAREVMELFTLCADRAAYTETDLHELARTLTGWRADWVAPTALGTSATSQRAPTPARSRCGAAPRIGAPAPSYTYLGSLVLENPYTARLSS